MKIYSVIFVGTKLVDNVIVSYQLLVQIVVSIAEHSFRRDMAR